MGQTIYLECYSGISGDMTVAALLDLGADPVVLEKGISSLGIGGYKLRISRVKKSGIDGCDFAVVLDSEYENHDHDMEYLHGYTHEHEHTHSPQCFNEKVAQNCGHEHSHRGLQDILEQQKGFLQFLQRQKRRPME